MQETLYLQNSSLPCNVNRIDDQEGKMLVLKNEPRVVKSEALKCQKGKPIQLREK